MGEIKVTIYERVKLDGRWTRISAMSTNDGSRANGTDVIGKVFVVRRHALRECLVCGEVLTRSTAPAHAETNCCPAVEVSLRAGGKHVT